MTREELQRELTALKAENERLKAAKRGGRAPSYSPQDVDNGEAKLCAMLRSLQNYGVEGATRAQVEMALEKANISTRALEKILERGHLKQRPGKGGGLTFHL